MDILEQQAVLKSFEVICDTREQDTERARQRLNALGVPYTRAKLNYGDYSYNATLPDGTKLFDDTKPINPPCTIERKMSLDELEGCFTRSRDRFRREFERAQEQNARIYLIVENASWENLINGKYRSKMHPDAFLASLEAWMIRYNLNVTFCKAETSARLIKEILYRDFKERLERGEFDNGKKEFQEC